MGPVVVRYDDAGTVAWVVLFGSVAGYDSWALMTGHTTMTRRFYEACDSSWAADVVVRGLWLGLTLHLCLRRPVLPVAAQRVYRRVHPLWRAHEALERKYLAAPGR